MEKDYYKNLIIMEINHLVNRKDMLSNEIGEIATYLDTRENNVDLTRIDIESINKLRNEMKAIYDLIDKLEELKKECEQYEDNFRFKTQL